MKCAHTHSADSRDLYELPTRFIIADSPAQRPRSLPISLPSFRCELTTLRLNSFFRRVTRKHPRRATLGRSDGREGFLRGAARGTIDPRERSTGCKPSCLHTGWIKYATVRSERRNIMRSWDQKLIVETADRLCFSRCTRDPRSLKTRSIVPERMPNLSRDISLSN